MNRPVLTFRRISNPEEQFGNDGTAYDTFVDGQLVGQVWRVDSGYHVQRPDGHYRFVHEFAWKWTGSGDEEVARRKDAAAMMPWPDHG